MPRVFKLRLLGQAREEPNAHDPTLAPSVATLAAAIRPHESVLLHLLSKACCLHKRLAQLSTLRSREHRSAIREIAAGIGGQIGSEGIEDIGCRQRGHKFGVIERQGPLSHRNLRLDAARRSNGRATSFALAGTSSGTGVHGFIGGVQLTSTLSLSSSATCSWGTWSRLVTQ